MSRVVKLGRHRLVDIPCLVKMIAFHSVLTRIAYMHVYE